MSYDPLDEVCDQCWEGEPRQEKRAVKIVAGKGYCALHLKEFSSGNQVSSSPTSIVTPPHSGLLPVHRASPIKKQKTRVVEKEPTRISFADKQNLAMREVLAMLQRERDELDVVIETLNNILLRRGG